MKTDYAFDIDNPEHLRERAEARDAYASQDLIEILQCSGEWTVGIPQWASNRRYRRAQKPVTRPWNKPSDVPGPVCWIRQIGDEGCRMVLSIGPEGIWIYDIAVAWKDLLNVREYSTDRIQWKPCTTTEP